MEQKREIIRLYNSKGLNLETCLEVTKLSKSSYYYKPNNQKGGKKNTTHTLHKGQWVDDQEVVAKIKKLLSKPFIDYGYRKVTTYLKRNGYEIGKKKVFRLMKENKLLRPKKIKAKKFDKNIVKDKPKASRPLEIIEIDIKYIYIDGEKRNAYLMTIFDVFHRQAYEWTLNYSMKTKILIKLILDFIDNHIIPNPLNPNDLGICFRTDNGSQFIAKSYNELMKTFGFKNVYLPPATPQLNGHIESFHSTVGKLVCNAYEFDSLEHAKEIFKQFFKVYNEERFLTCLLDYPPVEFLKLWKKGIIEQKVINNKLNFFFKEEDKNEPLICSSNMSSLFEVNLKNIQDFVNSQCKNNVFLHYNFYHFEK